MKILYTFFLFLILFITKCFSQADNAGVFHLDSLPEQGVLLDKEWKFHAGDNTDWSKPGFDDSLWEDIDPTLELYYLPQIRKTPIGWFRIHLKVDSSLLNKPLAFQVYQSIASEIYLNGELLQKYGTVNSKNEKVRAIQSLNEPVGVQFKISDQILAVRFSVQENLPYLKFVLPYSAFQFRLNDVRGAGRFNRIGNKFPVLNAISTGILIVLTIIHLGLFFIYRKQKANLFFALATLSGAIANGLFIIIIFSEKISFRVNAAVFDYLFLWTLFNLFLFVAIHYLFSRTRSIYFWIILGYSLGSPILWLYFYGRAELFAFLIPFEVSMIVSLRLAWQAYRKGQRDAGIIVVGLACYLFFYSIFIFVWQGFISNVNIGLGDFGLVDAFYQVGVLSMPIALSLYLSRDFAFTSKELEEKLFEVQTLSVKTLLQEQEKQQILASQKEVLEQLVNERTAELKQSLEDLESAQAQLIQSEKMASLGELTAGIAHEIQNPLNFVNNFSEVNKELIAEMKEQMEKGNYDEAKALVNDVEDNEEKIIHHGKRADAIVKGMLQHSRSSSGAKEATDINAMADELLRLACHGLRAKVNTFNSTMLTDFDKSIGRINIVPQDIGRVLLNLYNNAFYAVAEKRKQQPEGYEPMVSVSTKRINDKVEISVKDNGNGIPQKIVDKIFQPFFTTKPTGQGTGLGLSLAYDVIKAHGGEIKVKTKEGEGGEFIIQLPIV